MSWCFTRRAGNSDLTPRRELSGVVVKGNEDKLFCGIKVLGAVSAEGSSDRKMQSCFGPSGYAQEWYNSLINCI